MRDVIGKLSELDSREENRAEGVLPGRSGPLVYLARRIYLEHHLRLIACACLRPWELKG